MSQQTDISPLLAQNLFNVNGLNILITGAGSGLGSYMARGLAANGANKIVIIGRREEALRRTQASLPSEHAKTLIPVTCDVTSKESLSAALKTVTETHGISTLDVLICNSGTSGPSVKTVTPTIDELVANMLAPSEEETTNTFRVNLTGVYLTIATFLPLLDAANKARPAIGTTDKPRPQIITTSSIGGFNRQPLANLSYGPSKAGVVHMTKQLATLLVAHDIRANTIAPGLYMSEMTTGYMSSNKLDSDNHNREGNVKKSEIPATRGGDEQDMAGLVLWLCSRAGSYINGCVVVTDGGRLSVVPASY